MKKPYFILLAEDGKDKTVWNISGKLSDVGLTAVRLQTEYQQPISYSLISGIKREAEAGRPIVLVVEPLYGRRTALHDWSTLKQVNWQGHEAECFAPSFMPMIKGYVNLLEALKDDVPNLNYLLCSIRASTGSNSVDYLITKLSCFTARFTIENVASLPSVPPCRTGVIPIISRSVVGSLYNSVEDALGLRGNNNSGITLCDSPEVPRSTTFRVMHSKLHLAASRYLTKK